MRKEIPASSLGAPSKPGTPATKSTASPSWKTRRASDKGKTRKVSLEAIQEAINATLPKVHGPPKRAILYRLCIEQELLNRAQVAPNTFSRLVKQFDMLKSPADSENKHRLAFAKAHANEMWQADKLYGPHVQHQGASVQTRLIVFLDDASRVCCHGQFLPSENVDTLIEALRAAFYKRGVPACLYVDNGSIYTSKEIIQICARVGWAKWAVEGKARSYGVEDARRIVAQFPESNRETVTRKCVRGVP